MLNYIRAARHALVAVAASLLTAGCDHGLEPPDEPPTGTIVAHIQYVDPQTSWPVADSLFDLRFVAMRFVPQDTADFAQLNRFVFSPPLAPRVAEDVAVVSDVVTGPFLYSGVAWKYGADLFAWKPVGLVEENGGVFVVQENETTFVNVTVDFRNPPVFPPENVSR